MLKDMFYSRVDYRIDVLSSDYKNLTHLNKLVREIEVDEIAKELIIRVRFKELELDAFNSLRIMRNISFVILDDESNEMPPLGPYSLTKLTYIGNRMTLKKNNKKNSQLLTSLVYKI